MVLSYAESSLLMPYNNSATHASMFPFQTANPYSSLSQIQFGQGYPSIPGTFGTTSGAFPATSTAPSGYNPFVGVPNFAANLTSSAAQQPLGISTTVSMNSEKMTRSDHIQGTKKQSTDIPLVSGNERDGAFTPSDTLSPIGFSPSPSGSEESDNVFLSLSMIPTSSVTVSQQSSSGAVPSQAVPPAFSNAVTSSLAQDVKPPISGVTSGNWTKPDKACPNVTLGSALFGDMASFGQPTATFPWAQGFYPWSAAAGPQDLVPAWLSRQQAAFQGKNGSKAGGVIREGRTRTREKYRMVYSDRQRFELEKEFQFNKYITSQRKNELSAAMGLSERQIKIWFQNRRAKERKQTKKVSGFQNLAAIAETVDGVLMADRSNESTEKVVKTESDSTTSDLDPTQSGQSTSAPDYPTFPMQIPNVSTSGRPLLPMVSSSVGGQGQVILTNY